MKLRLGVLFPAGGEGSIERVQINYLKVVTGLEQLQNSRPLTPSLNLMLSWPAVRSPAVNE